MTPVQSHPSVPHSSRVPVVEEARSATREGSGCAGEDASADSRAPEQRGALAEMHGIALPCGHHPVTRRTQRHVAGSDGLAEGTPSEVLHDWL